MFEPGPTPATREDAIAADVEAIEVELRKVSSRLAALAWEASTPRPPAGDGWEDFCFGRPVEHDHSDIPRQVLQHKREALVLELARLRGQLVGHGDGNRRGWG